MLVSLSLQSQVASVIDMLAKSAVAEICKLIDDGSAVWQLEISRRGKENEALRRKLLLLEHELQLRETSRCGQEMELADIEETDIIFIKEENLDQDEERCDRWETDGTGALEPSASPDCWGRGSGEQATYEEQAPYEEHLREALHPAKEEKFPEQPRAHRSGEEDPGCAGGAVKAEIEGDHSVFQRPRQSGPEGAGGRADSPDPEGVIGPGVDWGTSGLEMGRPDPSWGENVHKATEERGVCLQGQTSSNAGVACSRWAEAPGKVVVVSGQTQVTCMYCGKHFAYLSYLKRHVRIHTGEKPYSCVHCGKRFTDGSSRNKHERIHTGRKPFSCAHCGKYFSRRCHLKRHQKLHGKMNELLSCG